MLTHKFSFARHLVASLYELAERTLVGAFETAEAAAGDDRDRHAVRRFRDYVFSANDDTPFYPADARRFFTLLRGARSCRWSCRDCCDVN